MIIVIQCVINWKDYQDWKEMSVEILQRSKDLVNKAKFADLDRRDRLVAHHVMSETASIQDNIWDTEPRTAFHEILFELESRYLKSVGLQVSQMTSSSFVESVLSRILFSITVDRTQEYVSESFKNVSDDVYKRLRESRWVPLANAYFREIRKDERQDFLNLVLSYGVSIAGITNLAVLLDSCVSVISSKDSYGASTEQFVIMIEEFSERIKEMPAAWAVEVVK